MNMAFRCGRTSAAGVKKFMNPLSMCANRPNGDSVTLPDPLSEAESQPIERESHHSGACEWPANRGRLLNPPQAAKLANSMSDQPLPFDPDAQRPSRALDAFRIAMARRRGGVRLRPVHPRRDNMWIERSGDGYALSLKKGAERFVLSDRALGQLASLLEVGPAL